MSNQVDLEVLVVSYNSAETLGACMASVEGAAPGTPIAIREHGADLSSRTHLAAIVAGHPGPVRIDDDHSNPGFAAGCNALARRSTATWLLFLNPDAEIVAWPWSGADLPPVDTIIGPSMVDSGHDGNHCGVRYRVRDEIARSWLRRRGPKPSGRGFVSGAALLIDRASFERVGGFDEGYFLFYEDIDLCLRANELGIETRVDERWVARHAGAHSTRLRFGDSLVWSYESAERFHTRHGHRVGVYRAYVVTDAALRSVWRLLHRDRVGVAAYVGLAGRAARDIVSSGSARSRS